MSRYHIEDADGAWYIRDGMTDRVVECLETYSAAESARIRLELGLPPIPSPRRPRVVMLDPNRPPIYGERVL